VSDSSQQPYFLRALYEWCVDNGHTPHLSVRVDGRTKVPMGFVKDGRIVLNVGPNAVRNLNMDNEWVTFSGRFGGVAHNIEVPVANIEAIYARETGAGMQFAAQDSGAAQNQTLSAAPADNPQGPPVRPKGGPTLKIVK
jgi:stringent starvation protein B